MSPDQGQGPAGPRPPNPQPKTPRGNTTSRHVPTGSCVTGVSRIQESAPSNPPILLGPCSRPIPRTPRLCKRGAGGFLYVSYTNRGGGRPAPGAESRPKKDHPGNCSRASCSRSSSTTRRRLLPRLITCFHDSGDTGGHTPVKQGQREVTLALLHGTCPQRGAQAGVMGRLGQDKPAFGWELEPFLWVG